MKNIGILFFLAHYWVAFGQSPVTDFTYDIRKVNCDYYLADFYYNSSNNTDADSCCWDFGDGARKCRSNTNAASHVYSKPGLFSVKLTLWKDGVESSIVKNDLVRVSVPPLPGFQFTVSDANGFAPLNVEFKNNTQSGDCEDLVYSWDFGDGQSISKENPNHMYMYPYTYYVTLNVTDTLGCKKEYSDYVIVKDTAQKDEFEFITSGCFGEIVTPPCGYDKHYKLKNDSLVVYGFYSGNCSTHKTATIRYSGDTIHIKSWEVGPWATCHCGYCFEIVVPDVNKDSVYVEFNGTPVLPVLINKIQQTADNSVIGIFPNPVNDNLILFVKNIQNKNCEYKILDMKGRRIQSGKLNGESQIRLHNLEAGVYIVYISDKNGNTEYAARFIKK